MIVGGYSHPGTPARASAPSEPSQAAAPSASDRASESRADDIKPTYFRSISSISYGSLAAAYQTMKAQEAADGASGEPAVLSGEGVPGAMSAYGDVIGDAIT